MPRRSSIVLGTAAALLTPRRGMTQALMPLTVGGTPTDDTTPVLYGVQSGVFRRAGLAVEITKVNSGAAAAAALVGGTFQVGSVNSFVLIQAHLRGVPLEVLVPNGVYGAGSDFIAAVTRADSTLQTGRDLNGKTVGVSSVRDFNAMSLMAWIDSHGGDSRTVRQVEIPYSAVGAALDESRIDVGMLTQPLLSQAIDSGKVRIFAKTYDAIAPHFVITSWATTHSWAAANADAARRFARAVRDAERYCNTHRNETAPLLAAFSGVELQQVLHGGRSSFAATFMNPRDLQPVIDAAVRYGAIDRRFEGTELVSPVVAGLRP